MADEDDDDLLEGDDDLEADIDGDDDEAPVLDDAFDEDEEDEDDEYSRALRPAPAPKRSTLRGSNAVGGVPRAKLDDPKVAAEVWQKLRDGVKNIAPVPYEISSVYRPDDIIEHTKFGVGFVIAVPGGNKVEVLFSDQVRKLVQGR